VPRPAAQPKTQTRQRLLDAAARLFADRGYADTTVQQIVAGARANIAAVNYHFGSKEQLYVETLRYCRRRARGAVPLDPALPPRAVIDQFVASFMAQLASHDAAGLYSRLMMREMAEPTRALDELVRSDMRPAFEALVQAIEAYAGGTLTRARAELCALSVSAECLFYHQNQAVVLRMLQRPKFTPAFVDTLREHVLETVYAIIRQAAGSGDPTAAREAAAASLQSNHREME
jgi:AcrR family transcriptional regulator